MERAKEKESGRKCTALMAVMVRAPADTSRHEFRNTLPHNVEPPEKPTAEREGPTDTLIR